MVRTFSALAAAALAVVLTGCGASSAGPVAATGSPKPSLSPQACSTKGHTTTTHWPQSVPKELPKPPNATINEPPSTTTDGVHIVKFTTPTSLRESVLFVVQRFPKAGFALGRGDAEATEADAPFQHEGTTGLVRMLLMGECQTQWLLATVDTAHHSPLLVPHPSGSASPLPFA
jgi:hypothetical protein